MEGVHRQKQVVYAADGQSLRYLADAGGTFGEVTVGDDLPLGDVQLLGGGHDGADRVGVQKRLPAKGHDGLDVVLGRNLPHRVGGDPGVDAFPARGVIPLGAVLAASRTGVGNDELDLTQVFQVGIHGDLLFLDGEQHPRLPLVRGKALLAGLSAVRHGNADRKEQNGIGRRSRQQIPRLGSGADHRQAHAPPHEDFPQVVGVAGVLPQPRADEGGGAVLAVSVHLYVSDALQGSRADREAEEQDTADIGGQPPAEGVDGGEDTTVDHQGGDHVDAYKADDGVECPCFFAEHGVAPVLMGEASKGIRPVGGEANRPVGHGDQKQNAQGGQFPPPSEGRQDNRRLDAPVGVVDRGVPKDQAEHEGDYGGRSVCDEKGEPPRKRKDTVDRHSHGDSDDIDKGHGNKAGCSALLECFHVLILAGFSP